MGVGEQGSDTSDTGWECDVFFFSSTRNALRKNTYEVILYFFKSRMHVVFSYFRINRSSQKQVRYGIPNRRSVKINRPTDGGKNPKPGQPANNWTQYLTDDLTQGFSSHRGLHRKPPFAVRSRDHTLLWPRVANKSGK